VPDESKIEGAVVQKQDPSLVAREIPADRAESGEESAVRIGRGGSDPRSSGADLEDAGGVSAHISGKPSPKQSSETRTAALLLQRLNEDGGSWGPPEEPPGPEIGVDRIARDTAGRTIQIQVTTPETKAWAVLAHDPEYKHESPDLSVAVAALRAAIAGKELKSPRGVVLALDATDSGGFALADVVSAFRKKHGIEVAGIGFDAIWLVGPVIEMVRRLDIDAS
jgi:hypothetical protein